MRFSRYNILSKQLSSGEYVLLNGMTGTLDLIDGEAYALISAHSDDEALSLDVLDQMEEVREHFLDRGYLTECTKEEELEKAEELALKLVEEKEKETGAFMLVPNLGCNYRCTYCFEQGAGYPALTMSKKQVDAVFEVIKKDIKPEESITLYGGEPLAKENRELIEYIVIKFKGLDNSFFTVTNGHDLDHYMDLLGSRMISSIQVTLDGPREIHDRRRISLDKSSSYDKVLANIEAALRETDVSIKLRINLDHQNIPFIPDFLAELDRRGILENPAVFIAASPVIGISGFEVSSGEILELEKVVEEKYPFFKERFINRDIDSNEAILPAFYFGQPVPQRVTVCGASSGTKIFCPDGSIYSCWSCVGLPDQVIGTFDEEGHIAWNFDTLDVWKKTMLPYNKECLGCKYAFLCAGGCRWQYLQTGSAALTYDCDYYHNIFENYLARVTDEYLNSGNE